MTPHETTMPHTLPVNYEIICRHEAAHAVMRWLRGKRSTKIEANEQDGCCHGTGRRISAEDAILITLAGFADETGYGLSRPVWGTAQADDIDKAREMIRECQSLRLTFCEIEPDGKVSFPEGDRLLEKWFDRACDLLWPYSGVVERLGWRLEEPGTMSARSVAATIREAEKRHDVY